MKSNIRGVADTKAAFRKITSNFGPALNQLSRAALAPMLAEAKANAPRRTGDLRRSLVLLRLKGSPVLAPEHRIGVRKGDPAIKYASLAEFGRPPDSEGRGGYAGARFMTRAFDGEKGEALKIIRSEWPRILRERIAKLHAKGITFK